MAKVYGVGSQLSGKVGQITYMQTKYGTVAYESKAKAKIPRRSEKQMEIRTQWVNLAAVYRQFNQTLKRAFEGIGNTMSVYNAFVQANIGVCKVYITKQMRLNGGSVLAPYQITRGTLPSISTVKNAQNILVSDIALGGLAITEETTVAEFASAIISYNDNWTEGDQLTFFYGVQVVDSVTSTPRAKITGTKVMLDLTDTTPLLAIVSALGFASVGGYLGMSAAITDGAAAWIHSREDSTGGLKIGTQFLYVDSTLLARYQTDSAFLSSADSYGGINTSAVYLQPTELTNRVGNANVNVNQNQTENQNSGGSGSSTGSETGGGSQTVTVAAPTFSGETQFTETTQVTMSAESGATIRYTLDGSTPSATNGQVYSGPVTLSATTTVKAVAMKDGVTSSVTTRTYTKTENGGGTGGGSGFDG